MQVWYEILGFCSGALGLSVAVPQLLRVLKAKNHEGVSLATWVIMLGNFSIWAAYGLRYDSISQLVTNIIALVLTSILVYVLVNQTYTTAIAVSTTLFTILGFVFLGYYTPVLLMTVLLFSMVLVGRVPQIVASWKHYRNKQRTVVSKTTYSLMIASSVGWITYGTLTGLWHNIVASSITLLSSIVIIFLETRQSDERQPV